MVRTILLLSSLGYILTGNGQFIYMGLIALIVIWVLLMSKMEESANPNEGFENGDFYRRKQKPTKQNPFGNWLISDKPNRHNAPDITDPKVKQDVYKQVKKMDRKIRGPVKRKIPSRIDDIADQRVMDDSMRAFYTMPCTQAANDLDEVKHAFFGHMTCDKTSGPCMIWDEARRKQPRQQPNDSMLTGYLDDDLGDN